MLNQRPVDTVATPIFASTACIPDVAPLLERLSFFIEAGIRHIELGARVVADSEVLKELPPANYLLHNYFPPPEDSFFLNLASADPNVHTRSVDLVRRGIKLSAALRAPFYSVHGGFVTDPCGMGKEGYLTFPPPREGQRRAAINRFTETIAGLLEDARRLGVRLLVENNVCPVGLEDNLLLVTPADFHELLSCVPDTFLGVLLDTGHLNVSAETLSFDPKSFIAAHEARITAVHLHGNDGREDLHRPISDDSWIIQMLRGPLSNTVIIVEATFDSPPLLKNHMEWIAERMTR